MAFNLIQILYTSVLTVSNCLTVKRYHICIYIYIHIIQSIYIYLYIYIYRLNYMNWYWGNINSSLLCFDADRNITTSNVHDNQCWLFYSGSLTVHFVTYIRGHEYRIIINPDLQKCTSSGKWRPAWCILSSKQGQSYRMPLEVIGTRVTWIRTTWVFTDVCKIDSR